ncbi:MAG: EAL domain-containing protein [Clostridiales Family XIII bacterium]|nr:EAL domain-containing protein [Clostridiales Family XIII bacterium]
MFFLLGITEEIEGNAFDNLAETTESKREQFERDMKQLWGNLGDFSDVVNTKLSGIIAVRLEEGDGEPSVAEIIDELTQSVSGDLVRLLRRNYATGAFLILNGEDGAEARQGLYFRAIDPIGDMNGNQGITIMRSPAGFSGLPDGIWPDPLWEPDFTLEPGDPASAFYYRPFAAALSSPGSPPGALGYWSPPFVLGGEGSGGQDRVITYSEPLMFNGLPYGVFGVEISEAHLESRIYSARLNLVAESGYGLMLGERPEGGGRSQSLRPVIMNGPFLKQSYVPDQDISIVMEDSDLPRPEDIYSITNLDSPKTVYAVKRELELYPDGSPFADEQWSILGIQSEDALLGFSKQINTLMMTVLLASMAAGVIGIVLVANMITTPIRELASQLRSTDPNGKIRLDKLAILEIDELSESIETLSEKVADANRKLADILEMAKTAIAVFEYNDRHTNQIIYTKQFAELIGLPESDGSTMKIPEFIKAVRKLKLVKESVQEPRRDYIYRTSGTGKPVWVRLLLAKGKNSLTGVITDVTREMEELKRLEYDRDYDILTDVYNRRAFHHIVSGHFSEPEKLGVAAVVMLDLDNLKNMNDTFGHDYGDKYIRLTAANLKKFGSEQTVVARLAGDEFIVFFHGYSDKSQIRAICDMIKNSMGEAALLLPDGTKAAIQISAGIAWYPDDSESCEELIRFADFAMYTVKKTNKGQFKEFDIGFYNKHSYLLYSRKELDLILEKELVYYLFQPIVDASTGDVYAYEALMRPMGETIQSPAALIALAQAHSRLGQIETLTLFKALEAFVKLPGIYDSGLKVFINSIASQKLTQDEEKLLEGYYGRYLDRVVVELTEGERNDEAMTKEKLDFMRAHGQELAIDDFGVGYNSESLMLKYQPDYIKIDMELIRNIHNDPNRQSLAKNLIKYGKTAGIKMLAEGVESFEEMEYLIKAGIDLLQGYYICRPMNMPPTSIPALKEEIRRAANGEG